MLFIMLALVAVAIEIVHHVAQGRASKCCGARENVEHAVLEGCTDDESEKEQELDAHYMYMAQIQEVTPDSCYNSVLIFDDELC
ncbi:hypothetical protein Tco_0002734 [Tanacetum coccineum]